MRIHRHVPALGELPERADVIEMAMCEHDGCGTRRVAETLPGSGRD
jgi:hypothetical protein